ncbi:MAG: hypothetical protein J0H44_19555 [Alphaproteobacteria bacterium]|nr:hypothetical protein [Alphaproteobacteria bacterium]
MATQGYSSSDALARLLAKVGERLPDVAQEIQAAIDLGKDVEIPDAATGGGRRKSRVFRRKEALTDREALSLAVAALRAYCVELPLFVKSTADNFRSAVVGARKTERTSEAVDLAFEIQVTGEDSEKAVEIASQTETQKPEGRSQPLKPEAERLTPMAPDAIEQQKDRLKRLVDLVNFDD